MEYKIEDYIKDDIELQKAVITELIAEIKAHEKTIEEAEKMYRALSKQYKRLQKEYDFIKRQYQFVIERKDAIEEQIK